MAMDERDAVLTLLLTPGLGHGLVARAIEVFGSASAAVEAPGSQWAQVHRVSSSKASSFRREIDQVIDEEQVTEEKLLLTRHGARLIALDDADYPQLLRHIGDPPQLLWIRGTLQAQDAVALAIVGSRRCSHYGREQADRLAAMAAEAGLCIVSGGAYGIDVAAHRAALRAGGRTIAVVGSGLADPYPKPHAELFNEIASGEGGAVMSELPMRTPPQPRQFPARNRIISGLSLGVLVVEAARRSGALITARLCVEDHGRECMVLPGRVDSPASEGCHKIIREGWATLVTNIADVLDCLGETGELLKVSITAPGNPGNVPSAATSVETFGGNDVQKKIIEATAQPQTLDQIAQHTGLEIQQVQSQLTLLEIRGSVQRQGGLFVRRSR